MTNALRRPTGASWIAFFLGIQIPLLSGVVVWNLESQRAERSERAIGVLGVTGKPFTPPPVGSKAPALIVQDARGRSRNLASATGTQCILLIGQCQPCVAEVLDRYDRAWQAGKPIAVVSMSAEDTIRAAAAARGWRLPIYSEESYPGGTANWKGGWRPWVMVVTGGRVRYAQSDSETWQQAADRVMPLLSEGRGEGGR